MTEAQIAEVMAAVDVYAEQHVALEKASRNKANFTFAPPDRAKVESTLRSHAEACPEDLAAIVRQLAYSLRKAKPDHTGPARAMEYLKRHGLQGNILRAQPEPVDGIELAARWVEKRLEDYDSEHGSTDPETGTREYPGRGAGEEYVGELMEIIEGIRALKTAPEKP